MVQEPVQNAQAPRRGRGLLANHQPLNPNVSLDSDLASNPIFDEVREAIRHALRCVCGNALLAHWQGQDVWVFYSRDNTHYADVRAGVRVIPRC